VTPAGSRRKPVGSRRKPAGFNRKTRGFPQVKPAGKPTKFFKKFEFKNPRENPR